MKGSDEVNRSEMEISLFLTSELQGQDIPPPDHASIDKDWNEWEPTSSGARSFKETVDAIETRIRRLSVVMRYYKFIKKIPHSKQCWQLYGLT